jgi:hypothetical protein
MRLWYWFLLAVTILGLALVIIGYKYPSIGGHYQQGFILMIYGSFALAFVLALAILYWIKWSTRWMNR